METILELEHVRLEKEVRLAWVTFTRERYLNAMSNAASSQLQRLAMALREESEVRVVVLRGMGRAFSTGLDLKEYSAGRIGMDYYERWENILRTFETMEKIVIAGLHGYCLGGALQLALACDIRVSTPDCQIGLPAIKESLIPGLGPWRLPAYVGLGRAKRMVLGGKNIRGEEAVDIGLVDHLVSQDDFFSGLDGVANKYLETCSVGMRMSKFVLNDAFHKNYDTIFSYYFKLQERAHFSRDADEAKRAYREKRDPIWG
jgi:enoyl-CoA hydratase/carnithine racemase